MTRKVVKIMSNNGSEEKTGNDVKILLVDDQPRLLDQAELFLEKRKESLNIETSGSPKKGLEMISEREYDVIVSDYQMPCMDGLEFLETVRKNENGIPFIMFTGKGREEVAKKALNLGADRYLQKKGNPEEMFSRLADAILEKSK